MRDFRLRNSVAAIALIAAAAGPAFADDTASSALGLSDTIQTSPSQPLAELSANTHAGQNHLDPSYGKLDAFYGKLDAFWDGASMHQSRLDAFYGKLDAFYGKLDAFGGSLDAFYGKLDAFYGKLDAFYGKLDAFYGKLDAFTGDPADLHANLSAVLAEAEASFGASVVNQTGDSFDAAVAAPLLARYNINAVDFSGADQLTRNQYAALLLELHDAVMSYTGLDHYDHWMASVNWSPQIAQDAYMGQDVKVGVLDTMLSYEDLIGGDLEVVDGHNINGQQHGAAVASVIAGAHDGKGVMGVAPDVELFISNPFDATHTASWADVRTGVRDLGNHGASVINISLGVSGWTLNEEWSTEVFGRTEVKTETQNVVFVKAAGNDGLAQQSNVDWTNVVTAANAHGYGEDVHERLLIVGSVDAKGEISEFSNTPGEACLLVDGQCGEGFRLMDRFLVAPGELLLTGNNQGTVSRATGTSFAAPLVTGAVALVQSKWAWLKGYSVETADIILQSARDLGAPGVDPVYGHGLLDVGAALAPLNPAALTINASGGQFLLSDAGLTVAGQELFSEQATITAFEAIGDTFRDFEVTVSSLGLAASDPQAGINTTSQNYLQNMTQTPHVQPENDRHDDSDEDVGDSFAFTSQHHLRTVGLGNKESTWTAAFTTVRRDPNEVVAVDAAPFQVGAVMTNNANGLTLRFGQGQGALAFSGGSAFGMITDHDIRTGGVNPFFGLASGGLYAGAAFPIDDKLSFAVDFTQDTDEQVFVDPNSGELRALFTGVDDYRASAVNAGVTYALNSAVNITAGYTQLNEATGLLGAQGAGAFSLDGGATTDTMTLGANAKLGDGFSLSLSATAGRTRATAFNNSILSVSEGGVKSTAFQIAAVKKAIFSKADQVRVSIAQPLHLEDGALDVSSLQVVDRETGELGLVTEQLGLYTNDRRFVPEVLYATSIFGGRGALSAFGQADINNREFGVAQTELSGGGRLDVRF